MLLSAFSSRDFRLLWTGQAVSLLGDAAFVVALGWRTFTLHGSGALGVLLMVQSVGLLLTLLIGGALADRYSRRTQMIASDLARAGAVGVLAAAELTGTPTLGVLGACAFAVGLGSGFFQPAFGGIVPLVVEHADSLASANALIGAARNGSILLGPAVAGLLYGPLGPGLVFTANAASFLVSAAFLWRTRPRTIEPGERHGTFEEIKIGFRYVASVPWLWVTIVLFSSFLMLVLAPFQVLAPLLVADHFDRGVEAYGLLSAFMGGGMVAGTLLFGQLNPQRRRGVLSYVLWTVNCGFVIGIVLAPWFELALGFAAVRGVLVGFGISVWDTMLMQRVPPHMLSRVISLDWFGSLGLMPIGFAFAAAVSGLASPGVLLTAGALVSAVAFVTVLPARWLREVD